MRTPFLFSKAVEITEQDHPDKVDRAVLVYGANTVLPDTVSMSFRGMRSAPSRVAAPKCSAAGRSEVRYRVASARTFEAKGPTHVQHGKGNAAE